MNLYAQYILPWLTHLTMGNRRLDAYRERVVSGAQGTVLEIGIGSGRNLPFYGPSVARIIGLDPSPELLALTRRASCGSAVAVDLLESSAEAIPLERASVDTVVMTWTLCSIPDAGKALSEMRRVLKPGGRLLFVEHGLAREDRVRRWQRWLDPCWWRVSCHLDRPMDKLIGNAGFRIDTLDTGYLGSGPKTITFMYEGTAVPR